MFDWFKSDADKGPDDVKSLRAGLLHFIKEELQKVEGGEGANIRGLNLFITCPDEQAHIYELAVYAEDSDRLKDEIQKIADDFAIDLPPNWQLEITFTDDPPHEAIRNSKHDAALFIKTARHLIRKTGSARIRILNGEAEQEEYEISSDDGKIRIGREKKAQDENGFFRINNIAFPGDSADPANKFVSRQHAHLEWNPDSGAFEIFADEGGVPPANKVKVQVAATQTLVKLNSLEIGHPLANGDQVILGESAVIEFRA